MTHILHYITGLPKSKGGVETFLLNLYSGIDKTKYRFSLLTRNYVKKSEIYEEIVKSGIEVYSLDEGMIHNINDVMNFKSKVNTFFRDHSGEFSFLHSHYIDDPYILYYAKKYGIKKCALHAHAMEREVSSSLKKIIKQRWASKNIRSSDFLFACSEGAGRYYYGNRKFTIIKNSIRTNDFRFSKLVREKIRKEFMISETTCAMCYTGRFSQIKNIPFLLQVVSELVKMQFECKLFLIGQGTDEEIDELKKIILNKKIENYVCFTGPRNDIPKILQGMDVYIQSSYSEGFSFSVLEAECAGLPCVISEGIPDNVVITDLPMKISLGEGPIKWADSVINKYKLVNKVKIQREKYPDIIRECGYDNIKEAEKLSIFYG